MSPIRRRIAQRLVEAQHTAALLTTFNEIDMSAVMALRNEHKDVFQETVRREAGLHVVLRQGQHRRAQAGAAGERRNPRQRHRLSQLLRYRHRRRRRQGAGRAGAARCRPDELRRDRTGHRRSGPSGRRKQPASSKSCKAARSRSPTAASTARCFRRRSSIRRRAASWACTRSRTGRSPAKARW